jgi:CrcB protein
VTTGQRVALWALVALGAALGGAARVWLGLRGAEWFGGFPAATLAANVGGSLLIGIYAALIAEGGALAPNPFARQFVMTGFCGGFTTFSLFSFETLQLAQSGETRLAALHVLVSVAAWIAAVALGWAAGRGVCRIARR